MRCVDEQELTVKKRSALNRLKTVRGHLDGIIRMLETDAYCVDVMKQISAVQSSLERANRVMLHNHLETCFSTEVLEGRGQEAIDELIDALKFTPALTGPQAQLGGSTVGETTDETPAPAEGERDVIAAAGMAAVQR
jgi:DNA-binding FrmR family transcriptional regulator